MSTSTFSASIPLTTIFTPPASCFSIVTYDGSYFWQGELFQTGDPDCYPTLFSSVHESFYSPGICPQGWISASSVTGTAALVSNSAESNALCCPTGYFVVDPSNGPNPAGNTLFCGSVLHGVLTNVYSTSTLAVGPLPNNPTTTSVNIATVTASPTAWAELLQVRWQATDTEILQLLSSQADASISSSSSSSTSSSTTSTSSSSTSATTTASPSPTSSNFASSSASASASAISPGAKIAIGITVPLVILALLLGAFIVWGRKKRRAGHIFPQSPQANAQYVPHIQELDTRYNQRRLDPHKLPVSASHLRDPSPARSGKVELPG